VDDGLWDVYFGPVKLGRMNERILRIGRSQRPHRQKRAVTDDRRARGRRGTATHCYPCPRTDLLLMSPAVHSRIRLGLCTICNASLSDVRKATPAETGRSSVRPHQRIKAETSRGPQGTSAEARPPAVVPKINRLSHAIESGTPASPMDHARQLAKRRRDIRRFRLTRDARPTEATT